jgi:hypothetical protein
MSGLIGWDMLHDITGKVSYDMSVLLDESWG